MDGTGEKVTRRWRLAVLAALCGTVVLAAGVAGLGSVGTENTDAAPIRDRDATRSARSLTVGAGPVDVPPAPAMASVASVASVASMAAVVTAAVTPPEPAVAPAAVSAPDVAIVDTASSDFPPVLSFETSPVAASGDTVSVGEAATADPAPPRLPLRPRPCPSARRRRPIQTRPNLPSVLAGASAAEVPVVEAPFAEHFAQSADAAARSARAARVPVHV